jgi:hypothetical protein
MIKKTYICKECEGSEPCVCPFDIEEGAEDLEDFEPTLCPLGFVDEDGPIWQLSD